MIIAANSLAMKIIITQHKCKYFKIHLSISTILYLHTSISAYYFHNSKLNPKMRLEKPEYFSKVLCTCIN